MLTKKGLFQSLKRLQDSATRRYANYTMPMQQQEQILQQLMQQFRHYVGNSNDHEQIYGATAQLMNFLLYAFKDGYEHQEICNELRLSPAYRNAFSLASVFGQEMVKGLNKLLYDGNSRTDEEIANIKNVLPYYASTHKNNLKVLLKLGIDEKIMSVKVLLDRIYNACDQLNNYKLSYTEQLADANALLLNCDVLVQHIAEEHKGDDIRQLKYKCLSAWRNLKEYICDNTNSARTEPSVLLSFKNLTQLCLATNILPPAHFIKIMPNLPADCASMLYTILDCSEDLQDLLCRLDNIEHPENREPSDSSSAPYSNGIYEDSNINAIENAEKVKDLQPDIDNYLRAYYEVIPVAKINNRFLCDRDNKFMSQAFENAEVELSPQDMQQMPPAPFDGLNPPPENNPEKPPTTLKQYFIKRVEKSQEGMDKKSQHMLRKIQSKIMGNKRMMDEKKFTMDDYNGPINPIVSDIRAKPLLGLQFAYGYGNFNDLLKRPQHEVLYINTVDQLEKLHKIHREEKSKANPKGLKTIYESEKETLQNNHFHLQSCKDSLTALQEVLQNQRENFSKFDDETVKLYRKFYQANKNHRLGKSKPINFMELNEAYYENFDKQAYSAKKKFFQLIILNRNIKLLISMSKIEPKVNVPLMFHALIDLFISKQTGKDLVCEYLNQIIASIDTPKQREYYLERLKTLTGYLDNDSLTNEQHQMFHKLSDQIAAAAMPLNNSSITKSSHLPNQTTISNQPNQEIIHIVATIPSTH